MREGEENVSLEEEKGSGRVVGQMYADTLALEVVEQAWRFLSWDVARDGS